MPEHEIGYDPTTDSFYCTECQRQYDDSIGAKTCNHKPSK